MSHQMTNEVDFQGFLAVYSRDEEEYRMAVADEVPLLRRKKKVRWSGKRRRWRRKAGGTKSERVVAYSRWPRRKKK